MKAILVIDMPINCSECKLIFLQGIGESICNAVDWEERPMCCPLKPMPNKRVPDGSETDQIYGCYVGWNACIDEILGETE